MARKETRRDQIHARYQARLESYRRGDPDSAAPSRKHKYRNMSWHEKFIYTRRRAPLFIIIIIAVTWWWPVGFWGRAAVWTVFLVSVGQMAYTHHRWKKSEPPEE